MAILKYIYKPSINEDDHELLHSYDVLIVNNTIENSREENQLFSLKTAREHPHPGHKCHFTTFQQPTRPSLSSNYTGKKRNKRVTIPTSDLKSAVHLPNMMTSLPFGTLTGTPSSPGRRVRAVEKNHNNDNNYTFKHNEYSLQATI